jgi:hypothetical protein
MRYEGVVKTDTHQQESEIAVLEIETDGEDVTGRFATLFDSAFGLYETNGGYRHFSGRVTGRQAPDCFTAVLTGRFACHHFDTEALHVEVEGERARIFEKSGGPVVTLRQKN